jgi:very-short-patch-repair endonuclease
MVARGELLRLRRGVYLVGAVEGPHTYEMAAVLACGRGAAASHRSGVHLYELLPYPAPPGLVHITRPGDHRRGPSGVIVHRTSCLLPYEIRERHGIPVTAPIRTLMDFACDCTDEELERAVAEAFALGLTRRGPLLRELEQRRGRRGTARLRLLLDGDGPKRTRSTPERKLLRALRTAGIDGFETNAQLGGWEVDIYWPAHRLVVEVDAYSTHSSPWAFERDRRKSAELEDLGLRVHRVTKVRIYAEPATVVAEIQRRITRAAS